MQWIGEEVKRNRHYCAAFSPAYFSFVFNRLPVNPGGFVVDKTWAGTSVLPEL